MSRAERSPGRSRLALPEMVGGLRKRASAKNVDPVILRVVELVVPWPTDRLSGGTPGSMLTFLAGVVIGE